MTMGRPYAIRTTSVTAHSLNNMQRLLLAFWVNNNEVKDLYLNIILIKELLTFYKYICGK